MVPSRWGLLGGWIFASVRILQDTRYILQKWAISFGSPGGAGGEVYSLTVPLSWFDLLL